MQVGFAYYMSVQYREIPLIFCQKVPALLQIVKWSGINTKFLIYLSFIHTGRLKLTISSFSETTFLIVLLWSLA